MVLQKFKNCKIQLVFHAPLIFHVLNFNRMLKDKILVCLFCDKQKNIDNAKTGILMEHETEIPSML